jgi:hypothetical protein
MNNPTQRKEITSVLTPAGFHTYLKGNRHMEMKDTISVKSLIVFVLLGNYMRFIILLHKLYFAFQKTYNKWFAGAQLISLLDLVLSLPEGAETDLLQNSDR